MTATSTFAADLTGDQRDAAAALSALFKQYGLESLAPKIVGFLQQGYSSDTVGLLLADTPEYKQRFAGNAARLKKGLSVLSPAEYVSTEQSYRQLMQSAGLPIGFYDAPQDFQSWIENDVSPTEVKARVDIAQDVMSNADPNTLAYYKQHYSHGDLLATILDPKKATPLIEQQYRQSQLAGAAANNGVNVADSTLKQLAQAGITQQQGQQGFGQIGQEAGDATRLGQIYGQQFTADDFAKETFLGDATAGNKRKKLASQERAAFSGSGGVGQTGLSQSSGGSF